MSKNGHPNGNGQHVTGSARIVATAAPTANTEKADLTINTPEALLALQEQEIAQRDNKVNLLKKALDGYAALTTNFGPTDFVRGAAFNFLLDGVKDIDAECGYPPWLMPQQYNYMYDREAIAKRVVDSLPEETWAEDPEIWEDDDPNKETPFEEGWAQLEEQHNLFSMLQRADVLSGIGQFGIILIGIDDGKDLREPVDGIFDDGTVAPEVEHKLLFLRVFSEVVVFVKVREIDTMSPRYSQPKIYTIQFRDYPNWGVQAGEIIARDIHWTRVIHLADNRKESEVYGIPRMQPVYNRLYDLRKIYSSSGEGYWKGAFPGLAFEVNPEVAAQGVELDVKSIREEMERFQNGLQRYLALTGVTTKSLPATMMEPGGCVETQLRAIAICLGIPERILWGSEEAVLAGNQDSRAWNKRLAKRQTKYVNPLIIRPFINRLIAMGTLPPPKDCMEPVEGEGTFIITGGYQIEWPDLNAPTDMDKAQVAAAETSAMAAYVQGGVSQLMAPCEYLTHVLGYSVTEADAILEASMEFSGDEEEPLSAASQAAQEQEVAEQAMEMQDAKAKGGKGENTKPERNSVGLAVNAGPVGNAFLRDRVHTILQNPSRDELQGLFNTVVHHTQFGWGGDKRMADGAVLRGVHDKGIHRWGSAYHYEHADLLRDSEMEPNDMNFSADKRLYALPDGSITDSYDKPHEVPGIGSKLQPAKKFVANDSGMENSQWQDGWKVSDDETKAQDKIGPERNSVGGLEVNAYQRSYEMIHNPSKEKLQLLFEREHRNWLSSGVNADDIIRGVVDRKGNHTWGPAAAYLHPDLLKGDLRQQVPTLEEKGHVRLMIGGNGRVLRKSGEGLHTRYSQTEVPGIGSSLEPLVARAMGDFKPVNVAGVGPKLKPVRAMVANAEPPHQRILTNPSKPDLQALFDTVHHRLESAQALGSDDVVLRGVISRGGDKHVWGNAFQYEHEDLKDKSGDSDIAKGSHLYIHPSGKIFKFGKGYQEQEYDVPGIGSKLKPVRSLVANDDEKLPYHTIEYSMSRVPPMRFASADEQHKEGARLSGNAVKAHNGAQTAAGTKESHLFVARNHEGAPVGALHMYYGSEHGEITYAGHNGEQSGVGKSLMLHALHYAEQRGMGLQWDATGRSAKLYSRAGVPELSDPYGWRRRFAAQPEHVKSLLDRGGRPELGERHYPVSSLKVNEEGDSWL